MLAIIAIAVSGCTSPGKADKPATHATLPARQAIKLAVSNVAAWRSDISTTTVSGTDAGGQISFAWTLREDSGFNESTVTTYTRDGKDVFPGGSDSVVTPTGYLLKAVLIEAGTHANVTVTEIVLSINRPANIQFPQASQTYVVPGT